MIVLSRDGGVYGAVYITWDELIIALSRDGGGENPGDGAAAERGLSQNDSDAGAFKY